LIFLSIFILSSCEVYEEVEVSDTDENTFKPESIPAGNDTTYNIDLNMSNDGAFNVQTKIDVKNTSEDSWNELVFYFVPNIFTEEVSKEISYPLTSPGTVMIKDVKIGDKKAAFTLEKDTLRIQLKSKLVPKDEIQLKIVYDFTLPKDGLRFTKSIENYHLAQFYPMLATYRNNKWNKEEYKLNGETYHTDFSNFEFTYEIPDGYTLISSSPNDVYPSNNIGKLAANQVKLFFVAILKDPMVIEQKTGHTNIKVFGFDIEEEILQGISDVAADALTYFEKTIGPYPHDQLEIVIDGKSMEYPGIVTAYSIDSIDQLEPEILEKTVVHEIAHQWFYAVISNDPFHEAWLDEGFAEFATSLYYFSKSDKSVPFENLYAMIKNLEPLPVNLALDEYKENQSSYIYVKSSVMLWKLFQNRGELIKAESFLKTYYQYYQYKEINSEEFIRFSKHYFNLENVSEFEEWLQKK
jgi:hypothetical protein